MRHVGWCDVYQVSNASVLDNPDNFPRKPSATKGCLHVRLERVRLDVPYCYEAGKIFANPPSFLEPADETNNRLRVKYYFREQEKIMFGKKASDIFDVQTNVNIAREKRKRESRKLPKKMQQLLDQARFAYVNGKYTEALSDLKQVLP